MAEGLARVRRAVGLYDSGGRLDDEGAARLGLDLAVVRVRDEAWALIDDRDAHVALWRDLTRRLEPGHVAPAASLLAAAAWHRGSARWPGWRWSGRSPPTPAIRWRSFCGRHWRT
ncbi:hypothetical protein GCM10027612_69630 [Microbispora bryophytorum subsp. camponoti]